MIIVNHFTTPLGVFGLKMSGKAGLDVSAQGRGRRFSDFAKTRTRARIHLMLHWPLGRGRTGGSPRSTTGWGCGWTPGRRDGWCWTWRSPPRWTARPRCRPASWEGSPMRSQRHFEVTGADGAAVWQRRSKTVQSQVWRGGERVTASNLRRGLSTRRGEEWQLSETTTPVADSNGVIIFFNNL